MRTSQLTRTTKETDIRLSLTLEGGEVKVNTGIGKGFFDSIRRCVTDNGSRSHLVIKPILDYCRF